MSLDQSKILELDASIPIEVVAKRESFDYLEGWYVINRANQIFGHGGWSTAIKDKERVQMEEKPNKAGTSTNWWVGYIVTVAVTIPGGAVYEDMGFGQGIDKDMGKAHESATKEAVTDAIKRCLKNTGLSMGLALYDKTKTGVAKKGAKPKEKSELQIAKEKLGLDSVKCHSYMVALMDAQKIGQQKATEVLTNAIIEAANANQSLDAILGLGARSA